MKKREKGFLSKNEIDHKSEQFDYIGELHDYLWQFVRCEIPEASGKLNNFLDRALEKAKKRAQELEGEKERLKYPNMDDLCNNCKKEFGFHRADDNKCPISEGESYDFDLSTTYFNHSCKG